MAETIPEKRRRLRRERNRRVKLRHNLLNRAAQHLRRIKVLNAAIKRLESPEVPGNVNGWHPKAIRTQVSGGIGGYIDVPPRGVLHTTEGSSLPNYPEGAKPQITIDVKRRLFYQHISIFSGSTALENDPGGVETNRAHAVQIEMIGFAKDTQNWTAGDYAFIAGVMRWVEKNAGVRRDCTVKFVGGGQTNHLSNAAWLSYSGWLGHQHVPENAHWDPGLFQIGKVL